MIPRAANERGRGRRGETDPGGGAALQFFKNSFLFLFFFEKSSCAAPGCVTRAEPRRARAWVPSLSPPAQSDGSKKKHILNIPYGISSPLLDKMQRHIRRNPLDSIVLLVQDEFSERMAMNGGPRSIGPLGLSLWLDFTIHLGSKVSPSAFSPPPRVNSRLVMLQPRETEVRVRDRKMFKIITQHCFSNRRRKMRTLLSKPPRRISRVRGWHKDRWGRLVIQFNEEFLEGMRIGWLEMRPDDMLIEEWLTLCNYISDFESEN